jgi:hypothetical protein
MPQSCDEPKRSEYTFRVQDFNEHWVSFLSVTTHLPERNGCQRQVQGETIVR